MSAPLSAAARHVLRLYLTSSEVFEAVMVARFLVRPLVRSGHSLLNVTGYGPVTLFETSSLDSGTRIRLRNLSSSSSSGTTRNFEVVYDVVAPFLFFEAPNGNKSSLRMSVTEVVGHYDSVNGRHDYWPDTNVRRLEVRLRSPDADSTDGTLHLDLSNGVLQLYRLYSVRYPPQNVPGIPFQYIGSPVVELTLSESKKDTVDSLTGPRVSGRRRMREDNDDEPSVKDDDVGEVPTRRPSPTRPPLQRIHRAETQRASSTSGDESSFVVFSREDFRVLNIGTLPPQSHQNGFSGLKDITDQLEGQELSYHGWFKQSDSLRFFGVLSLRSNRIIRRMEYGQSEPLGFTIDFSGLPRWMIPVFIGNEYVITRPPRPSYRVSLLFSVSRDTPLRATLVGRQYLSPLGNVPTYEMIAPYTVQPV